MSSFDYKTYLSPFTWRYGSPEMREIWSEVYKRKLWRKVWVALAKAQHEEGLVSKEELDDLMAEVKAYGEKAKVGAGKIHLGATSMDVEDNADTVRMLESLVLVEERLKDLLAVFVTKIDQYKATPCMGYTHLQPAEPTTIGYRFALYGQDLLLDKKLLNFVIDEVKGKGMRGAVGTAASYVKL